MLHCPLPALISLLLTLAITRLLTLLQLRGPPPCCPNTPGMILPQGLCTSVLSALNTFPRYPQASPSPPLALDSRKCIFSWRLCQAILKFQPLTTSTLVSPIVSSGLTSLYDTHHPLNT